MPDTPASHTDTDILNWMQREGLESIVRCPQFDSAGNSLGICLWASHWAPGAIFATLRNAALDGMEASQRSEPAAVSSTVGTKSQITNDFRRQLRAYLADATAMVWRMQDSMSEAGRFEDSDLIKASAELLRLAGIVAGIVSRWELIETQEVHP